MKRLLLIDNNQDVAEMFEYYTTTKGHRLDIAKNIEDANLLMETEEYNLIICGGTKELLKEGYFFFRKLEYFDNLLHPKISDSLDVISRNKGEVTLIEQHDVQPKEDEELRRLNGTQIKNQKSTRVLWNYVGDEIDINHLPEKVRVENSNSPNKLMANIFSQNTKIER